MLTGKPTPILKLPICEPDDHPDFLTDYNEIFRRIDKGVGEDRNKHNALEQRVIVLEEKVARLESALRLQEALEEKGGNEE